MWHSTVKHHHIWSTHTLILLHLCWSQHGRQSKLSFVTFTRKMAVFIHREVLAGRSVPPPDLMSRKVTTVQAHKPQMLILLRKRLWSLLHVNTRVIWSSGKRRLEIPWSRNSMRDVSDDGVMRWTVLCSASAFLCCRNVQNININLQLNLQVSCRSRLTTTSTNNRLKSCRRQQLCSDVKSQFY